MRAAKELNPFRNALEAETGVFTACHAFRGGHSPSVIGDLD